MRLPVDEWNIINHYGDSTPYQGFHYGMDIGVAYVPLYAPVSGTIEATPYDTNGGQWINFRDDNGYLWLFAHLSKVTASGRVGEGTQIGVTGNTGSWTTGPHLHFAIKNPQGQFIDPEPYMNSLNNTGGLTMSQYEELKNDNADRMREIGNLDNAIKELKAINATRVSEIQGIWKDIKEIK
jgi:murein DD-endopeptidase MepM/ murein hydrolase activator NlpD